MQPGPNPDDLALWDALFAEVPAEWRTAPPSAAMTTCADWLRIHGVRSVLDLGCGVGRWTIWLAQQGFETAGVDFAPNAVDYARRWAADKGVSVPFVCGPVTAPAFPGRVFDAAVAALVLDLVSRAECRAAIALAAEAVRPGGFLVAVFNPEVPPASDAAGDNPTAGVTHVSYTDAELTALFGETGFEVITRADFELGTRGFLCRRSVTVGGIT